MIQPVKLNEGVCPKGVLSERGFVPGVFVLGGFVLEGFCPTPTYSTQFYNTKHLRISNPSWGNNWYFLLQFYAFLNFFHITGS